MRYILLLIVLFACSSPDYKVIIDELEISRNEIAQSNARKLDFFKSSISDLKDCYGREYPELDSAFSSIAQLTVLKQQIVNSKSTTEFSDLINSVKKFEKKAVEVIGLNHENSLSKEIDLDLASLKEKLPELPVNVLKQILISKLERWNLLATELKLSRYAIEPCMNSNNNQ